MIKSNKIEIISISIMVLLFLFVGFLQSWSLSFSILNMCIISAIMSMGINMQWGYAGIFNVGIMGFTALGGLAAVLVGDNPASKVYVNSKSKVFKSTGCFSETYRMDENSTEEEILDLIENLNNNNKIHGILVQLPLPKHIDSRIILNSVDPNKDVDGFHPLNLGSLLEGSPKFIPCTPNGIIEIIKYYNSEGLQRRSPKPGRMYDVEFGEPKYSSYIHV